MKNRKSEGNAAPNAKNVRLKQAGDQQEEAQLPISKQPMTNRPLSLAENVATDKAVYTNKYVGRYKISILNRVTMISLAVRELEKRYGLEGMIDANIIYIDGKVLMGIQDINKVLQDYEEHHACTCK